jgi:hypothetical protein
MADAARNRHVQRGPAPDHVLPSVRFMEGLLARLERSFGRFAIPHLIRFIVGGMAMVWALSLKRPDYATHLTLDLERVRHGEVWRLITFLFLPPPSSSPTSLWIFINLYFTWWVGSSLEQNWGAFKFNAYYAIAAAATILAAAVATLAVPSAPPLTNVWLDGSLFLAFATVFPDVQILLFLVIPVRVKWMGIVAGIAFVYFFAVGDWSTRAEIAGAIAAYGLFFSEHWSAAARQRRVVKRQQVRRTQAETGIPVFGRRVCAICGAREADGVDVRVCSCQKCGGKQRDLCLQHARNH